MAKINVDFDTKTKDLSVTMDGQRLSNVTRVSLYRGHDENDEQTYVEIGVETAELDVDNEISKRVSFYSHGSVKAQAAIASGDYVEHPKLPGLIGVIEIDPVIGEVADFFDQKLGS